MVELWPRICLGSGKMVSSAGIGTANEGTRAFSQCHMIAPRITVVILDPPPQRPQRSHNMFIHITAEDILTPLLPSLAAITYNGRSTHGLLE